MIPRYRLSAALRRIARHLGFWREIYIFPLLGAGLIFGVVQLLPLLTGRAVIDDPGAIAGWAYNFGGALLVIALAGIAQTHLIGYRGDYGDDNLSGVYSPKPRLADDIFDACTTAFLLLLFSWLLFCR
jgi:hypothetical protein